MRRFAVLSIAMFSFVVALNLYLTAQDAKPKTTTTKPATQTVPKPGPTGATKTAAEPIKESGKNETDGSNQPSLEVTAIRQTSVTYVKAFNQANAKAVAEHYTTDAEYVDESGHLIQGRQPIEESLVKYFKANPESKIDLSIESIRFVGPGVAVEDGTSTVLRSQNADPVTNRYTVVHLKTGATWLVASVRETSVKSPRQHRAYLKQLDWMLGEWVHEGSDAVVFFSCELADRGNFLIRNFTIQIAGQEAMSGSQRIGWDAQTKKLKAWVFDSDGGHSEGSWHRDGDNWVLKTTGVTADGQPASSTSIYTFVNEHTMTFQSVDHEIGGVELPDGAKVKIVRHAPQPGDAAH